MSRKHSRKLILLILLILVLFFMNNANAETGKGSVAKRVTWSDDTPIEGALVHIDEGGIYDQETDFQGWVVWHNLDAGSYHLSVDIDDDGTWETTGEPFDITDGQVTTLYNSYEPPKARCLYGSKKSS